MRSEQGKKGQVIRGAVLGGVGICVIVLIVIGFFITPKPAVPVLRLPAIPAADTSSGAATAAGTAAGIGRSAAEIERILAPLGFEFERASALHGVPRLLGRADGVATIVELMGPEGSLSGVNTAMLISRDGARNTAALKVLGVVAAAVRRGGAAWAFERIGRGRAGEAITETTELDGARYELRVDLTETLPLISLTMTR